MKATEWFHIKDRGDVASFEADEIPEGMWEPNDFKGQVVEIDGHQYKVLGVETYAIGRSPENPYQLRFGLLVKKRLTS